MDRVSWYDEVGLCNKLSALGGKAAYFRLASVERDEDRSITSATVTIIGGSGYRLPTEAGWEHACRAGTTMPYHFGSSLNGREANVNGNWPYGTETIGPTLGQTKAVGSYGNFANAFGLNDMQGNVWTR